MNFNNTTNHSLNECFQEYDMKFHEVRIFRNENHDLANARSSSSRADPGLRVAFKCLNV